MRATTNVTNVCVLAWNLFAYPPLPKLPVLENRAGTLYIAQYLLTLPGTLAPLSLIFLFFHFPGSSYQNPVALLIAYGFKVPRRLTGCRRFYC